MFALIFLVILNVLLFLIIPKGAGAFEELKIHVLHTSLLIIAMISPYSKRGVRLLGNSRFIVFFLLVLLLIYFSHDYSHSQKDGNSRLLFLQLVIPKFGGNSDSWSLSYSTSGVLELPALSKYRQRGGPFEEFQIHCLLH